MDKLKIGKSMRIFLLVVSVFIWLGIWHTGFQATSLILYLVGAFLLFAAVSGICPGLFFSKMIAGELKGKQGT